MDALEQAEEMESAAQALLQSFVDVTEIGILKMTPIRHMIRRWPYNIGN